MRYVLAIDTAFSAITVAVMDCQFGTVQSRSVITERGQAEQLVPMIGDILNDADIQYNQLNLIAVSVGPGSFTGVRVGIATARGLGLALNIPVQGVVTTDALYDTWVSSGGSGAVMAVIDTKRDDLYVAHYAGPQDVPIDLTRIKIGNKDEITGPIIGDGAAHISRGLTNILIPEGGAIARLGLRLYQNKNDPRHGITDPVYIREAEVSVSKRAGRIPLDPAAAQL